MEVLGIPNCIVALPLKMLTDGIVSPLAPTCARPLSSPCIMVTVTMTHDDPRLFMAAVLALEAVIFLSLACTSVLNGPWNGTKPGPQAKARVGFRLGVYRQLRRASKSTMVRSWSIPFRLIQAVIPRRSNATKDDAKETSRGGVGLEINA